MTPLPRRTVTVLPLIQIVKHKPTNVGRIAFKRQARQFNSGAVA